MSQETLKTGYKLAIELDLLMSMISRYSRKRQEL